MPAAHVDQSIQERKDANLRRFYELFVHADDAYAQSPGTPFSVPEPLTLDILRGHAAGGGPRIGSYLIAKDDTSRRIVIDIDVHEDDPEKRDARKLAALAEARRVISTCDELGISVYPISSKSGGYHLTSFWPQAPAGHLKRIGEFIVRRAGLPEKTEVFPKQANRQKTGNMVWLPLYHSSVKEKLTLFLDADNGLDPLPDQAAALRDVVINSLETLASVLARAEKSEKESGIPTKKSSPIPEVIDINRNVELTKMAGKMRRAGATQEEIEFALLAANKRCGLGKKGPLPEDEVLAIARNISKYPPGEELPSSFPEGTPPVILSGDLAGSSSSAWKGLQRVNDPPKYFIFGGLAVRLDTDAVGALSLLELTPERLRHEVATAMPFIKRTLVDKSKEVRETRVAPPADVVADMLATPTVEIPLPRIDRLVTTPTFAKDGTLCGAPGYNEKTRTYYTPPEGVVIPDIPMNPNEEEVSAAYKILVDPFCDFPFDGDADLAHTIALMLLPFVRDLISGPTPMHLIESSTPGGGKGKCRDVALTPGLGARIDTVTPTSEDEIRKRITSLLMAGAPAINLDNAVRIESAQLASALTAGSWCDRVLGRSGMVSLPVRAIWTATANNPVLSTEIVRRCIRIRINPKEECPWKREGWKYPQVTLWAEENRGALIGACLVLVRAWLAAGRPRWTGRTHGSFEEWTQVIGGIMSVAGVPDFLGNLDLLYESANQEGDVWREFTDLWWQKFRNNPVGVTDLFPLAEQVDGIDLGRSATERGQKTSLGARLREKREKVIGDYQIVSAKTAHRLARWKLVPLGQSISTNSKEAE